MLVERVIGGFVLLTRKQLFAQDSFIRIFITSCFYILWLEDKEGCFIIDEEAGEVEGVE
jgi:hypothetical protein